MGAGSGQPLETTPTSLRQGLCHATEPRRRLARASGRAFEGDVSVDKWYRRRYHLSACIVTGSVLLMWRAWQLILQDP